MKKFSLALVIPLVVMLTACGPNNPLIGQWESEPMMGVVSSVEFRSGAMVTSGSMGGMSSSSEIDVKEYKVEKDTVGVVLEQGGSSTTMTFTIVDNDTIVQDMGFVKARFHRKK